MPDARVPAWAELPADSDGRRVCKFIERFLVHGEGDHYGAPFILTDDQARFIHRGYERRADGHRRYKRVLCGRPKGSGKTALAAAIAIAELGGPVAPKSAVIPVAAASFEQADLVFGTARAMVSEGPLEPFFELYDTEILRRDGPGRMYRVAAAGTNDGARPTFLVADEVHEWTGNKERVHLILSNGLAKRRGAWQLNITTAGSDMTSLLARLYAHGRQVEAGEVADPEFLFDWQEAPEGADLSSVDGATRAIRGAYGDALGVTIDLEAVIAKWRELPEYEFTRYYLNRFTAAASKWLPLDSWERLADRRVVADDEEVVLGFDGSYNRDSTALVGCTLDGYVFVVGAWERPPGDDEWRVPRSNVDAAVAAAMRRWNVRELACDPPGWHREVEEWAETYGSTLVLMFETNRRSIMSAACSRFYTAVMNGDISHDGDPRLARHLANAVIKETTDGAYITKDGRNSLRKIDLAVAAVVAYERAGKQADVAPLVEFV
jgi:phage terminase large subunit-like protein